MPLGRYRKTAGVLEPPSYSIVQARQHHSRGLRRFKQESGIALIMTLMVITLAAGLTIYIGSTSYFGARLHKAFVQRTQAEYILKSALNLARVLISQSQGSADPPKDSWGPLTQGVEVPGSMLGIETPNVIVGVEITGVDGRLSLSTIRRYREDATAETQAIFRGWRDRFARLFKLLEFDDDNEKNTEGPFKDRFFDSNALVANLIDYMDEDTISYSEGDFSGIESSLPQQDPFPSKGETVRLNELYSVPGFTPERIRRLTPFVTDREANLVNINLASLIVLRALDDSVTESSAQEIINFAKGPDGPYDSRSLRDNLPALIPNFNGIANDITVSSAQLQVIAKVQYGSSRYFLRAYLEKASNTGGNDPELPEIKAMELFG